MPRSAKKSVSFVNAARIDLRRARDDRAARRVHLVHDERRDVRDRREEDVVERLLLVVLEQQVVDVRLADLARVARIDRAVLAAGLPHLLATSRR